MADQTTKTIIVGAPVEEAFAAWADFERFPLFMENVKSVTKVGDRLSHWVVEGPLGKSVEWDADTTLLEPNTRIAWRSREGSAITTSGMVTFTALGNGQTQITLTLQWDVPAAKGGDKLAELFTQPEKRLEKDLYNFKSYLEGLAARA
jgi:uncharacterized membrane protein